MMPLNLQDVQYLDNFDFLLTCWSWWK